SLRSRYVAAGVAVLVLMGPDGGLRSWLIDLAASAGTLGKKVFVIDAVPQNVLLDYTASADVGIIPYPPVDMNSRLCTPNKLFEYIVAGLPILANDLPELRRFVADNRFGQVHTLGTAREIARAIDRMLASDLDPYREELTRRCHEFTWARQGEHIASLYAGFIAAARAGHVARSEEMALAPSGSGLDRGVDAADAGVLVLIHRQSASVRAKTQHEFPVLASQPRIG